MKKLYVKIDKKRGEKPEEFFDRLYKLEYITTYYNKDCTNTHDGGNGRSFNDLYCVFKTYFPKISQKQLIKIIYNKCKNNKNIYLLYCNDINKIVVYLGAWYYCDDKILFNKSVMNYNGYITNKELPNDKFTIKYLFKKIGFTEKEINKELNK